MFRLNDEFLNVLSAYLYSQVLLELLVSYLCSSQNTAVQSYGPVV
jgi:hypothetical protein